MRDLMQAANVTLLWLCVGVPAFTLAGLGLAYVRARRRGRTLELSDHLLIGAAAGLLVMMGSNAVVAASYPSVKSDPWLAVVAVLLGLAISLPIWVLRVLRAAAGQGKDGRAA